MTEDKEKQEKKSELLTDLDAFTPERHGAPERFVKFRGKKYKILSFLDLEYQHVTELLQLDEALKGKGVADQMKLALRQVEILIPDMPAEVRNQLTGKMIIKIAVEAFGVSGPPQEGSESE